MLIREEGLYLILAADKAGPYIDFGWEIQKNTYSRTNERPAVMLENFKFQDIFDLIKRV